MRQGSDGSLLSCFHTLAAALFFVCACASMPRSIAPATVLGSSSHLLAACNGSDLGFCRGFVVAALDDAVAAGSVCWTGASLEEAIDVVVGSLHGAATEEAREVVALALAEKWPCSVPAETTPGEPARASWKGVPMR